MTRHLLGFKSGILLLAFFGVVALTVDCFSRSQWLIEQGNKLPAFDGFEGAIAVNLAGHHFSIRNGEISRPREVRHPEGSAVSGGGDSRPDWLPRRIDDYIIRYDGPYARSPDDRMLVAGADTDLTKYNTPVLLIVDFETNKIISQIDSGDEWEVRSVAWSPQGTNIAILRVEAAFGHCWFENLAYYFGHPVELDSFWLDVYDTSGSLVASTAMAERLPLARGEIVWSK